MATACAANGSIETAPIDIVGVAMDEHRSRPFHISIPIPGDESPSESSLSTPQPSPRTNMPLPNPPFEFPGRPESSSASSSTSKVNGRRRRLNIESAEAMLNIERDVGRARGLENRPPGSPALPEFSFNPGARSNADGFPRRPRSLALPQFSFSPGMPPESGASMLSPPLSPSTPRTIPGRGGHRRYGSEFVGGSIRTGDSITVMSTSPTKSESPTASPTLSPDFSRERRGRHAHRRSAAISSHDLTTILKPTNPPRNNSAPTSPVDSDDKAQQFPGFDIETPSITSEEYTVSQPEERPAIVPVPAPSQPEKPAPRARVGFSDTLEFIPRPLSMVSTDTGSTVRPGHSVSGSLSSIISMANSTTADRDSSGETPSPPSSQKSSGSRPSTAGAVLDRTASQNGVAVVDRSLSPPRRNSNPSLTNLSPPHVPSHHGFHASKSPKRWSFFGLDSLTSSGSPTRSRLHGSRSWDSTTKSSSSDAISPRRRSAETADHESQVDMKNVAGKKKKQKKVKTWAGSILTRKSKSRSQKPKSPRRRSLTPPLPRAHSDEYDGFEDDDAVDSQVGPIVTVTKPTTPTVETTPAILRRHSEDDAPYPVIDLDAALGPFNTPLVRDPAWEEAQRAGAPPKRQLHSAAGLRGFAGPGMHYHRRAESAPEMPPFEIDGSAMHRFGSSSTMAEVFEEEEEEDDDSEDRSPSEETTPAASGVSVVDAETILATSDTAATMPMHDSAMGKKNSKESLGLSSSAKRKGSGSSLESLRPSSRMRTETSANSLHEEIIVEEGPAYQAVDQARIYETIDPLDVTTPSPRQVVANPSLSPAEFHQISLPPPSLMSGSPFSISQSSSFPSPRSPMSYDPHHVSTAPSSFTEEIDFQSLLLGEPGPEVVRISTEVPSVNSSNSTVTRESNFPGVRPRGIPFPDQRPASFSVTTFGRRRSSLASLSRLINSAHGERSKLSIEVPCGDESEKTHKASKTKRWSRMMQFWKAKGSTKS
jgi:hypothetical protein